jgi:hypothetical protein
MLCSSIAYGRSLLLVTFDATQLHLSTAAGDRGERGSGNSGECYPPVLPQGRSSKKSRIGLIFVYFIFFCPPVLLLLKLGEGTDLSVLPQVRRKLYLAHR